MTPAERAFNKERTVVMFCLTVVMGREMPAKEAMNKMKMAAICSEVVGPIMVLP